MSVSTKKIFDILPIATKDLDYVSKVIQMRWHTSPEWAIEEAKKHLAHDALTTGFCVHYKNDPVGVGLFNLKNDEVTTDYGPWLYLLWIDPEYRGNDLGIELTRERMKHARKHGYAEIYLDTSDARPYHRKLGWEDITTVLYEGAPVKIMKYDLSKDFPQL